MSHASPAELSAPIVVRAPVPGEGRFLLHGVEWRDYVLLNDTLGVPGLRMAYLRGTLELMTTSPRHEDLKKTIARLIELYALERDVALYGYGSATFRKEAVERGAEPDECYVVGATLDERADAEVPDIALEVVLTSGGIDKLAVYAGLGVREVWFYEREAFTLFYLREGTYEVVQRSLLLPGLDFEALSGFVKLGNQHRAVAGFREWLREPRGW